MSTLSWIRRVNGTVGRLAPQTIANQKRRAFMTPRDMPPRDWELPLLAQSESVFHVTGLATKVTFGFNASGDIDHLVMLMDGRETKAIRR